MAMGNLNPPSVTDGTKDFGAVLVAWGLVPSHSANLVVEFVRESLGRRLRSAPVHEHEFEAFVSTGSREVVEYLFDGAGFGRRSGHHAHAERQARDVHADDALGTVGSTIGTALVVEGCAPIGGPAREVGVYDHH